jgi:hypothetical protein
MKTSELTGDALDWAVATALERGPKHNMESHGRTWYGWWLAGAGYEYEPMPRYSTDWAQGGPIIDRQKISIIEEANGLWLGSIGGCTDLDMPLWQEHGPTPLIAAMRCYVASKLGDDIDVPEELQ